MAVGERRPVTILFTDIVGSTALAERLDPEEFREVVAGAQRRVIQAVTRYEGTIAQLQGDGALAFFGAPIAHEDDPARAVHAALDIQAAITDYARELAGFIDDFAMRAGIHTGEVVTGELGSEQYAEYTAMGDAINLAARLQSAAAPGKVLISETTARLVRQQFELTDPQQITVQGKRAAVTVCEVVRPTAGAHALRGLLVLHSPLVGREVELGVLTAALEGLCQGHGGIVALLGEAGIGKSRLVGEAHAWAREHACQPPRWLEGRALAYGSGLSYWTISQLLRADLGLSDGDPEVRARVALRRRLNALSLGEAGAGDLWPYLAHLLGLPLEGEAAEPFTGLDSETRKHQLLVSTTRYFRAVAEREPLVLVCDDTHWADPSTLDALAELLHLADHVPLLLLLVGRAERKHGFWRLKVQAETEYAHRYTEIVLQPLGERDSRQLVDNLLAAPGLPESLRRLLLERAEGNPFYLEELVASLVEDGTLVQEGEAWRLKGPVEGLRIPDTLQGVLLARFDRLERDVRSTLQMASVIGRSFLYRLLRAVAEAEAELDRHMVLLQRADLVREKAVRPELEYIFKHSLAQEAAYESLLLERRREFHRRVGEALEDLFPDRQEQFYGLLAHHFDLAEQGERAVRYLIAAGDQARMQDSLPEAARFYRRAVERLEAMGDAEGVARTWLKLALVHQADFDFAAAHDAYERAFASDSKNSGAGPGRAIPSQAEHSPDAQFPLPWAIFRQGALLPANGLEPAHAVHALEGTLLRSIFAGIAQVDAELNVVPFAARSWQVLEGGRCYRVHLRPDVRWSDGSPVTADDYVFAWLRNISPGVAWEYPARLLDTVVGARDFRHGQVHDPDLVGVHALDDLTLEVRLESPVAYFPYVLTMAITYPQPRPVVERWGDAWWQPEHIVSNGPFRLTAFNPQHVVLDRNELYFGERAGNVAHYEYFSIPDEAERVARFRSGELDLMTETDAPPDLVAYRRPPQPIHLSISLILHPEPPLDDVRVRRAIALALDRQGLAESLNGRLATGGIVPPGIPGHSPGLALPRDPETARRLLAEAGYPRGRGLPVLRIPVLDPRYWARLAESLQTELGVEVELELADRELVFDRLVTGRPLRFWGWKADMPDPDDHLRNSPLRRVLGGVGWQDVELDEMLERAAHLQDRAGRMALYRAADRRLVQEQVLVVPLRYGATIGPLARPWVRNLAGLADLKDIVIESHESA